MKAVILYKVESLHMYKNIFGKHRIEVRTISGDVIKINSDSETASLEKLRLIALAQTAYEEAAFWSVKALTI